MNFPPIPPEAVEEFGPMDPSAPSWMQEGFDVVKAMREHPNFFLSLLGEIPPASEEEVALGLAPIPGLRHIKRFMPENPYSLAEALAKAFPAKKGATSKSEFTMLSHLSPQYTPLDKLSKSELTQLKGMHESVVKGTGAFPKTEESQKLALKIQNEFKSIVEKHGPKSHVLARSVPSSVKNEIRKHGNLGFATSEQAATAILKHKDWYTRWDLQPKLKGVQKYEDGTLEIVHQGLEDGGELGVDYMSISVRDAIDEWREHMLRNFSEIK